MIILKPRKSRLTIVLILSFLFCIAATIFLINELAQNQAYFTRSFGKEQELLVKQIADRSKDALNENPGNEQGVIDNIIKTAETSGNRYWFLTKENELLFYKNSFEMDKLKIKDVNKILYSIKSNDGYNIDVLRALSADKTNGTVLFSTSKTENKILVSVFFFQVNNTNYSIGMCTTEAFILSAGKIVKHNTYSIMVLVLVCLILFPTIIAGTIIINKREEEILTSKKIIRAKNMKIEELTQVNFKSTILYNDKTNLYSKEVLYALLKKANRPELFPFSMLVINLDYSENITYDDLVLELTSEINNLLPKTSVSTRVQDAQLAVLFFKTEYGAVKDFEKKLLHTWSSILKKFQTSVHTDVITQFIGQDAPIDVFELWNKINPN